MSSNSVFTVVHIFDLLHLEFVPLLKDDENIIISSAVNGTKD